MRLYIDSDQQDYLQTLKSLSQKFGEPFAYKGMPIEMSRRIVRDMQRDIASGGPKISNVEQLSAIDTGCPVDFRIYSPDGVSQSKTPVLIYAHGGGFCINSVDTHDCLHREYADRLGWLVVAPEYRKAPEHPFPTAIDDISSVANWLIGNAELLKIDVDNFFIGGDSAGGNLALTVPLSMAQKGSHPFRGCIVNYGVLDGNFGTDSYERYGDGPYLLSTADMARFFDWYLDDPSQMTNPLVCPLLADLSSLPPIHICTGEIDVLASENIELHKRLRTQGVDSELHVYSGVMHGFVRIPHLIRRGGEALDGQVSWLKSHLHVATFNDLTER